MSVTEAHMRFYAALNANIAGDTAWMHAIWAEEGEVTNMGPFGGVRVGREAVLAQFDAEAAMDMSGAVVPEDVRFGEADDMGFSTCIERGIGMRVGGEPVEVCHRATNIFRREAGGWRIVHHHTDRTAGLGAAG